MSWKRIIAESGVILAVAVLLSVAANSVRDRSHRLAWLKGEARARVSAPAASQASGQEVLYVEVSAAAAARLHESGALFLDARRTAAYEAGHIAGARSIPVWENDADARVESLRGEGVRYDRDIVIYCSGPTCEDSSKLAEKLALAGYFKLHVYKNGFPEWENNGRPVRQGAAP